MGHFETQKQEKNEVQSYSINNTDMLHTPRVRSKLMAMQKSDKMFFVCRSTCRC
jgi:hypothetical protein